MLLQILIRPLHDNFQPDLIGLLTRLQYPRPIPASLLKSSNVESIYGIFCWLVQILDPAIPVQTKAGSDDDRLNLLNGIVSELSTRFDICIDMTHFIPAAGDRAVKELIKVGSIIEKALYFAEELSSSSEGDVQVDNTIEATRRASALVDEITEICSRLSNHLEKECDDSKDRTNALHFINSVLENNPSARDHCNLILSRKLDMSNSAIERLDRQCKILISNQRGTEEKIQKKSIDLERSSKRLESVKTVRPAYMDEYEKLEKDLEVEYERYVLRLRNKDYLAGELSSFNQAATEVRNKLERSMKRMQEKFREDELRVLKGCSESDNTPM